MPRSGDVVRIRRAPSPIIAPMHRTRTPYVYHVTGDTSPSVPVLNTTSTVTDYPHDASRPARPRSRAPRRRLRAASLADDDDVDDVDDVDADDDDGGDGDDGDVSASCRRPGRATRVGGARTTTRDDDDARRGGETVGRTGLSTRPRGWERVAGTRVRGEEDDGGGGGV